MGLPNSSEEGRELCVTRLARKTYRITILQKKEDPFAIYHRATIVYRAVPVLDEGQEGILEAVPILLNEWIVENIPERLTVFAQPEAKRKKLRTSNLAELRNKELKKRTRLIRILPNKESLLKIASAILMELNEEWLSADKRYMKMEP